MIGKYIDAEKLKAEIQKLRSGSCIGESDDFYEYAKSHIIDIIDSFQQEQPIGEEYAIEIGKYTHTLRVGSKSDIDSLIRQEKQEQPEVDLEKFTEKIDAYMERYKYPESVSIRGAMAFTARMFYQYPNAARQWYEQLPKATMD